MRNNFPISASGTMYGSRKMSKLDKKQLEEQIEKIEEVEGVHDQIDWFERTRVYESKRTRYANLNLNELKNYQDALSAKITAKRQEQEK